MTSNIGTFDRLARLILGALLIAAPFLTGIALFQTQLGTVLSVVVGIVLIATSAMRFCPLYRVFGIRTCKI